MQILLTQNIQEAYYPIIFFKAGNNSTATTLQCLCNHLTSFGGYFVVTPNKIDFDKVVQFSSDDPKDYIVIMTVSMVFLVYFIALVFARRADKRDLEKVCH